MSGCSPLATEGHSKLVVRHPLGGLDAEQAMKRVTKMRVGTTKAAHPTCDDATLETESALERRLRHTALLQPSLQKKGGSRARG